ncbi:MAG: Nif11-like leader peptide family natural product precursor [Cyanobium sp.]
MSWSELERLVETAEQDRALSRALRHCRSRSELVLAAQRLQFLITLEDLHRARLLDGRQTDESLQLSGWNAPDLHRIQA